MKLCKDCKHYNPVTGAVFWGAAIVAPDWCGHPSLYETEPVEGGTVLKFAHTSDPHKLRSLSGACGPDAKMHESTRETPTWLDCMRGKV